MKYWKMIKKIAQELIIFFKKAVPSLYISENSSIINQNFQNIDDADDRW